MMATHSRQVLQSHHLGLPPTDLRSSSVADAPLTRPSRAKAKVASPLPVSPGLSASVGTLQTTRARTPSVHAVGD